MSMVVCSMARACVGVGRCAKQSHFGLPREGLHQVTSYNAKYRHHKQIMDCAPVVHENPLFAPAAKAPILTIEPESK